MILLSHTNVAADEIREAVEDLQQIKDMLLNELRLGEIWDFDETKFIKEGKLFSFNGEREVENNVSL